MKYSRDLRLQPGISTPERLQAVLVDLIRLTEDDTERSEWQRPKFEVNTKDETFSTEATDEFLNYIKHHINNIKGMRLSYSGTNMNWTLSFRNYGYSSSLDASVEASDKGTMLSLKDTIENKLLVEKSWNFLADKLIPLGIATTIIAGIFLLPHDFRTAHKDVLLIFFIYPALALTLWPFFTLSRHYPALVIKHGAERSGRIFKKDIWAVTILIILPIVVGLFT